MQRGDHSKSMAHDREGLAPRDGGASKRNIEETLFSRGPSTEGGLQSSTRLVGARLSKQCQTKRQLIDDVQWLM